jgi:maleate cis-trans isomerase
MEHISNERQVDIITTAHNQIMAGKPIDIDHIVNLDPKTHYMNAVEKKHYI